MVLCWVSIQCEESVELIREEGGGNSEDVPCNSLREPIMAANLGLTICGV